MQGKDLNKRFSTEVQWLGLSTDIKTVNFQCNDQRHVEYVKINRYRRLALDGVVDTHMDFMSSDAGSSPTYGGPQLSRQNQKPHGKNKNLTAKPKTSRQKQLPTAKPKLFCCCSEVFDFAERFLVLPWCFCFCREAFGFAVTVVGHHSTLLDSKDFSCEKKFKFSSDLFGDYWRSGRQNSNKTFIPSLPNKFCGIKENNISFS